MRQLFVLVAVLAAVRTASAQYVVTKEDEAQIILRATKNCEIAAAVALPRVPGLEILSVNTRTPELEKQRGSSPVKPFTYSMVVDLKVRTLGREEKFSAVCFHDLDDGAKISSIKLQL